MWQLVSWIETSVQQHSNAVTQLHRDNQSIIDSLTMRMGWMIFKPSCCNSFSFNALLLLLVYFTLGYHSVSQNKAD